VGLWDRCTDAEKEEQEDVGCCAIEIDGSTTEPCGKRPRARVSNELKTRIDQVELERFVGRDTGFCVGS